MSSLSIYGWLDDRLGRTRDASDLIFAFDVMDTLAVTMARAPCFKVPDSRTWVRIV